MQTEHQILASPSRVRCVKLRANISVTECVKRQTLLQQITNDQDKIVRSWHIRVPMDIEQCVKCEQGAEVMK